MEIVPFSVIVFPDPMESCPLKRFRLVLMVLPEFRVTPPEFLILTLGAVFDGHSLFPVVCAEGPLYSRIADEPYERLELATLPFTIMRVLLIVVEFVKVRLVELEAEPMVTEPETGDGRPFPVD